MADFFVDSSATGLNDGSDWANAYTTLAGATSAISSNDRIIIANTHTELLTVSTTYTLLTNNALISSTVSGANTITATAATSKQVYSTGNFDISFNCGDGCTVWGMYISAGDDLTLSDIQTNYCTLEVGVNGGGNPSMGPTVNGSGWESNYDRRINKSTSSNDPIVLCLNRTIARLHGGTIESDRVTASTVHTAFGVQLSSSITANGVDCSSFSNENFVEITSANDGNIFITNCKLNSGTTSLVSSTATKQSSKIVIDAVDETDMYRRYINEYRGQLFSDDTIYITDANAKPVEVSNRLVSNTEAQEFFQPVRFQIAQMWVDTSTAKTFTVEIAQDGTTTNLKDSEIWLEVQYPDDTSNMYHYDDDRASDNQTTANQTTSTTSWTGLSGTNARQKLEVTTSQTGKAGLCTLFVCLAKPSTTVYVSPVPTVT